MADEIDSILVDDEVVAVTNKWREKRGDPPLVRPEFKPVGI